MIKFIRKLFKKIDEDSPEFRIEFINRIKDKKIKYLSERITHEATGEVIDTILGKEGFFHINNNGELVIYCDSREMFRANIPGLKAYEFLSLEGVILEGVDLNKNIFRQIIAYYKYYR